MAILDQENQVKISSHQCHQNKVPNFYVHLLRQSTQGGEYIPKKESPTIVGYNEPNTKKKIPKF